MRIWPFKRRPNSDTIFPSVELTAPLGGRLSVCKQFEVPSSAAAAAVRINHLPRCCKFVLASSSSPHTVQRCSDVCVCRRRFPPRPAAAAAARQCGGLLYPWNVTLRALTVVLEPRTKAIDQSIIYYANRRGPSVTRFLLKIYFSHGWGVDKRGALFVSTNLMICRLWTTLPILLLLLF